MSTMKITDLPPEALACILKELDWRSRIKCETVCRQFSDVCKGIYATSRYPWIGLPRPMKVVVSTPLNISNSKSKLTLNPADDVVRVLANGDDSSIDNFPELLKTILVKWSTQIELLDIRGFILSEKALNVLRQYPVRQVDLNNCRFSQVPTSTLMKAMNEIKMTSARRSTQD